MLSERVAVILADVPDPARGGLPSSRLFDVFEKLEKLPDPAGGWKHRLVLKITNGNRQPVTIKSGELHFTEKASGSPVIARPKLFVSVRASVHGELQKLLGDVRGFCG